MIGYAFVSIKRNTMKNHILLLALLSFGTLSANTSGFVEYDLPETAKTWSVLHQEEGTENVLIGSITVEGAEFFGAIHTPELTEMPDMSGLQEGLQVPFPDQKVKASVIESNEDSLLYEWSASDETQEVVHGWGRIFCSQEGLVTLNYTTGQVNQVDALRPVWLETLRSAHKTQATEPAPAPVDSELKIEPESVEASAAPAASADLI